MGLTIKKTFIKLLGMMPKLKKMRKLRAGNKAKNSVKKSNYKLKVKSSAKKRFSLTATGLVKATQANKRHNMRKRSARQIREQRGTTILVEDAPMLMKVCNLKLH
jgi:large subunit ribosomal protein L35